MHYFKSLVSIITFLTCSAAWAATDGTYVLDGGAYSINAKFSDGAISVVEPNKTSVYRQRGDSNEYFFSNPNNDVTYGLRIVDSQTLEAFKPVPGNEPSTLKLRGASNTSQGAPASAKSKAIAEHYMALSQSDPVNTQTWTQCGSAALAYTYQASGQADETARLAASLLKILGATGNSPCPDAISNAIWASAD